MQRLVDVVINFVTSNTLLQNFRSLVLTICTRPLIKQRLEIDIEVKLLITMFKIDNKLTACICFHFNLIKFYTVISKYNYLFLFNDINFFQTYNKLNKAIRNRHQQPAISRITRRHGNMYQRQKQLNDKFHQFAANYQKSYQGPNKAKVQIGSPVDKKNFRKSLSNIYMLYSIIT